LDASVAGNLQGQTLNDHAISRHGFTTRYNFIIDQDASRNPATPSSSGHYLMARLPLSAGPGLPPIGPAPEARVFLDGRAASLGFLGMKGTWLADHSYQQADMAFDQNGEGRSWAPFAGIDGAYFRLNTGSDVTFTSATMVGGIATRDKGPSGSFLLGAFAEAGYADYDIDAEFSDVPDLEAHGTIRSVGGGLMARGQWENGFRIEGSLRAGRLENEFAAPEYQDGAGHMASYNLYTPYFAAHGGLAYTIELDEANSFDILARYFWTRLNGADEVLPNGEMIFFEDSQSQRLRVGGRITHKEDENRSWYIGAAYEYEFDGDSNGHNAQGLNFATASLKGSSGVIDVGLIARSHPDSPWSLEVGLQGYVGEVQGISGGIRLAYEF
jgi:outer membrane autotransporter protein